MKASLHRQLPIKCPSCSATLAVRRLACDQCGTAVEGRFPLSPLARLDPEAQAFVVAFVRRSGNLKAMAQHYGVSYPTVRNRLDAVISALEDVEAADALRAGARRHPGVDDEGGHDG